MKNAIPLLFAVTSTFLFVYFSNSITYNFFLSGAVADGNQALDDVKISVEKVATPMPKALLYYEHSSLTGGYELRFSGKNQEKIILHYEKLGYGKFQKNYTLKKEEVVGNDVRAELRIAHLFNFRRYKTDEYIGSFNRKNVILFDTSRTYFDTLLLDNLNYFTEVYQQEPHQLKKDTTTVDASWYEVNFVYNNHEKQGFILYENEKDFSTP